jgi:hypothetical protein
MGAHCPHGHEYTPQNTKILASGSRACRACQTRRTSEYMRKKRANEKAARQSED